MTSARASRLAAPAAFAALTACLALYGCAGGCGGAPAGGGSAQPQPAQQGPGGGNVSGGDPAQVSRFDSPTLGASGDSAGEQARDLAPSASTGTLRVSLRHVALEDLPRILRAETRDSVVLETAIGCEECRIALPAFKQAARDFSERYDFFDVDLTAAGSDPSRPMPILLMYRGAKQTSRQLGMPFPREKRVDGTEDDFSYQRRFSLWLRDALIQRNLKFARR